MGKVLHGQVKDVVVAGVDSPGNKVGADDKAAGVGVGGTHVCVVGREVDAVVVCGFMGVEASLI